MRIWHLAAAGTVAGAALAYLLARQASPETFAPIEEAVGGKFNDMISRLEGFRSEPYQDQAGFWTIGFGHLIVPGDGFWSPINPGGAKSISVAAARALYESDTLKARRAVDGAVTVELTANQYEALVSLAYNIGASAFASSTLVKKLNAGDYEGAAEQFAAWNKVRDPSTGALVVSDGLVARRDTEQQLFMSA